MIIDIFNTKNKYNIIYADPPWSFETYSNAGKDRSADNHYKTMGKKDIQELPIRNIADTNCILFLWVTFPNLLEGLDLIKKWGFVYKTCAFNWIKTSPKADLTKLDTTKEIPMGLGYYTRANSELCLLADTDDDTDLVLLARKGSKSLTRQNKGVRQVLVSPRREHSRKPDEVRDRIVTLFGDVPRIELFSRTETDGWDCWGNEVEKFK